MFCPKCGSQNADETKFCRGCGGNLGNVLAVVEGKAPRGGLPLAEKQIELSSRGWRGLLGGTGFLIVASLAFALSGKITFPLFMLVFAFVFISTGISRFIEARGLKRLLEQSGPQHERAISSGQPDYIQPQPRSLFATDDLTGENRSVTENTTTRLELHGDTRKQ